MDQSDLKIIGMRHPFKGNLQFGLPVPHSYFIYFARYGNVGFSMKNMFGYEGIIRSEGLKIYFIEVIEYWMQSACRFLVTTDTYPQLREYNPRIPGGPLYYHYESREFYYLKTIKRHDGSIIANRNVVEIMKEPLAGDWYYRNHQISISDCINPRIGVNSIRISSKFPIKEYR